jgi:type IV pilus assembly protein PilM
MPRVAWGLDIGHSSLKAARIERVGSAAAELTSFDVIEIEPGEDENTRPARARAALEELLRRRRIGSEPVIVAVPGNQTFFRPFSLPAVAQTRLAEIVRFEANQQIPFPINEVLWDYKQIAPGEDRETRVGLVAVRRELVEQILSDMRSMGLKLEAIQVSPLALYNFILYEFGGREPWLVLDAGARVTDFVVCDSEDFWFRPLPQSGNDLTRALEQKFRMNFEEAEALKIKMGESKQAKKIFQVVEPMLRNLVGDIQRTIGYYKGIRRDAELGSILAVGNSWRLPGLVQFVEQALGVEMELLKEIRRIQVGVGVDVGWWNEEVQSMAVALGLGLQGVGLGKVSLELMPERIMQERMVRRKRPVVAAGVGVALLASIASFLAARHNRAVYGGDIAAAEAPLGQVRKLQAELTEANRPVEAKLGQLREWSEGAARERGWVLECLQEIGKVGGAAGVPVLGPQAAGGNGVYVREIFVSRRSPVMRVRGMADDVVAWYKEVSGEGTGRAGPAPMVVILRFEVGGRPGLQGAEGRPDAAHAQALREAIASSSRIILQSGEEVAGLISETDEDRNEGVLRVASRDGGQVRSVARADIERLMWFRDVTLGADWHPESRPALHPDEVDRLTEEAREKGTVPQIPNRIYGQFTMAWTYDDGRDVQPAEEAPE